MTHLQLNTQNEDALFDYISGENDTLVLDTPVLHNYYYLMGWYETKAKLARSKIIPQLEEIANCENTEDWEF